MVYFLGRIANDMSHVPWLFTLALASLSFLNAFRRATLSFNILSSVISSDNGSTVNILRTFYFGLACYLMKVLGSSVVAFCGLWRNEWSPYVLMLPVNTLEQSSILPCGSTAHRVSQWILCHPLGMQTALVQFSVVHVGISWSWSWTTLIQPLV